MGREKERESGAMTSVVEPSETDAKRASEGWTSASASVLSVSGVGCRCRVPREERDKGVEL